MTDGRDEGYDLPRHGVDIRIVHYFVFIRGTVLRPEATAIPFTSHRIVRVNPDELTIFHFGTFGIWWQCARLPDPNDPTRVPQYFLFWGFLVRVSLSRGWYLAATSRSNAGYSKSNAKL